MRLAALVLVVCSLAAGCKKKPTRAEEEKKVTATSTDDATAPIVDEGYRFKLSWPGPGWKLLREKDARHLNQDAVAGLSNDEVNAVVIVEHAPGGTLAAFADLIIGNLAIENKQIERTDVTVSGEPAVQFTGSGAISDLQMEIRGIIVSHQEHIYQVIAFAPKGMAGQDVLAKATDAFSFVEGKVERRTVNVVVEDQVGVGWRVEKGVFESAASRLRVAPPAGWRLMVGEELKNSNEDAEIGMAATDLDAYVAVITEPIAEGELETYRKQRMTAIAENLTLGGDAPEATVAGRKVPMTRAVLAGGAELEFALGVFGDGKRAYQVMGWYPKSLRDRAEPLLAKAFVAIELLDARAAGQVAKAIEAEPDHQSAVGATYALRGGVYQDFAQGLRWRKPAKGFWQLYAGQDARARNADALIGADEVATGLGSQIIVEDAQGVASAEFHQLVVDGLVENGFRAIKKGKATVAGAPAEFAELVREDGGIQLRYRATTAITGGKAIQVAVWALAGAWPEDEALLSAVAEGLELAPGLEAQEDGPTFRDHRLGFAMALDGWSHSDITPNEMRPVASMHQWRSGSNEILAIGTLAFDQKDDQWVLDLIEQTLREENAGVALDHPKTETAKLAGRDARHLTWNTAIGRIDAYLIKRDSLFYGVLARDTSDKGATAEAAVRAFALLD
jgi:hypothetical protein